MDTHRIRSRSREENTSSSTGSSATPRILKCFRYFESQRLNDLGSRDDDDAPILGV